MTLIFDKVAPLNICSKDNLNHFLVNSSAKKNSLRRAKNVVFFLIPGVLMQGYALHVVLADNDFL